MVHEFIEIFYQDIFDQLWIPDDEVWAVEDVDSAVRDFEVVVYFPDSVEKLLFCHYLVEASKNENWFFERDVFGFPVGIVFCKEVVEKEQKTSYGNEKHLEKMQWKR